MSETAHDTTPLSASSFPDSKPLVRNVEYIPASTTPEPYKGLLVHDLHMTVTMETFHRSPVEVKVIDRRLDGDVYSRKILLQGTKGLVRKYPTEKVHIEGKSKGHSWEDMTAYDRYDHTLWKDSPTEITDRLGWLSSPADMKAVSGRIVIFEDRALRGGASG